MTDLIDTYIFMLSPEQSVNLYVCFGGSGICMVAIWTWLPKASQLIEPKSPLKRALGLMITLLIPSRDINVCDAFDGKAGCSLWACQDTVTQGSWAMGERLEKKLSKVLTGRTHVIFEDMTQASPILELTDGNTEKNFGC